jgi:Effector Associated Constant Component 1
MALGGAWVSACRHPASAGGATELPNHDTSCSCTPHVAGLRSVGMAQLRVQVEGLPDSDDQERAELADRLREELLYQGVEEVAHPQGRAPDGAKGPALEWAQLVVGLVGSVGPLLAALRGWTDRHPDAAITLEIEGDKITLDKASAADRERLVETFLARHAAV